METQKIINFLNDSSNEESKFARKEWYVMDSQTVKGKYDQNNSLKLERESTKSSLRDYSDAFIFVTGDIKVNAENDTYVAFKNCTPFSSCKTEINDVFIDEANHVYIAMPMYNLIVYSDKYSDTSGSLWQFKRDDIPADNVDFNVKNGAFNSESFKYEAVLVGKTAYVADGNNSFVKCTKIVVPLKYLRNFWRSLEMPLINYKIHLELNWIKDCILSSVGDSAKFKIMDAKLHVPIVYLLKIM